MKNFVCQFPSVTANQPDSKPCTTCQALAGHKVTNDISKNGSGTGVDVGRMGGRGGSFYCQWGHWGPQASTCLPVQGLGFVLASPASCMLFMWQGVPAESSVSQGPKVC